jgi:copper homeostasis protein
MIILIRLRARDGLEEFGRIVRVLIHGRHHGERKNLPGALCSWGRGSSSPDVPMKKSLIVEVCVESVESALAAGSGGAHRLELCSQLSVGGTTPDPALIVAVLKRSALPIHVMIRPRAGDFCYSDSEYEVMMREIEHVRRLGADGVVLGVLTRNFRIDVLRTRNLVALAHPMSVTFHRAFDRAGDLEKALGLEEALEDVIATGAHRLLTSGGASSAEEGIPVIACLVQAAGERLKIMAGVGISAENVSRILRETGVNEIHGSFRARAPDRPQMENQSPLAHNLSFDRASYAASAEEIRSVIENGRSG